MGKPTPEELQIALGEAVRLREGGEDEYFLGKTLLNHNYRLKLMDDVLMAARRYLHSGESPQAHRALQKAIEKAESADHGGDEDVLTTI